MKVIEDESMMSALISDLKKCNELVGSINSFQKDLRNIQTFANKWNDFKQKYRIDSETMRILGYNFEGFLSCLNDYDKKIDRALEEISEINIKSLQRMDDLELLEIKQELSKRVKYLEKINHSCVCFMDEMERSEVLFRLVSGYLRLEVDSVGKSKNEIINFMIPGYHNDAILKLIDFLGRINGLLTDPNSQRDFEILTSRKDYEELVSKGCIAEGKIIKKYWNVERNNQRILSDIIHSYKMFVAKQDGRSKFSALYNKITNKEEKEKTNIMMMIKNILLQFFNNDDSNVKGFLDRCILENYDLEEELGRFGIIYLEENLYDLVGKRDRLLIEVLKNLELYFEGDGEVQEDKLEELLNLQELIVTILKRLFLGREEYVQMLLRVGSTPISIRTREILRELGIDEKDATVESIQKHFDESVAKYVTNEINLRNSQKSVNNDNKHLSYAS